MIIVKIGADIGDPRTVTMEDIESGVGYGEKKPEFTSGLQRHMDTALAIAGDNPPWISAFLSEMKKMFDDLAIHLDIITSLDGSAIYKSQKKFVGSEVSLML